MHQHLKYVADPYLAAKIYQKTVFFPTPPQSTQGDDPVLSVHAQAGATNTRVLRHFPTCYHAICNRHFRLTPKFSYIDDALGTIEETDTEDAE